MSYPNVVDHVNVTQANLQRIYIPVKKERLWLKRQLVANLVILHNVDSMSKVINKLKRQGFKVDAEALRSLSPYRTEHINLLGTYSLKIPKQQGNHNIKLM